MSAELSEIDALRQMLLIRAFEERVETLFGEGRITGTSHTAIGQEAVCVGVCSCLGVEDAVTSTHRGHGHFIARGGDPARMMAELFGKATGYSGGRGGSQLMADFALGFMGGNGITGGSIPTATGLALAMQYQHKNAVTICFFGDGAVNQGAFHESLNMASLWKLPVIYACENNGYAMSTPVRQASAVPSVALRASAYGMVSETIDGNDVFLVRDALQRAACRSRSGDGPSLLEFMTYRQSGHSRGDPRVYRTREEEKEWRQRDPILLLTEKMQNNNTLTDALLQHEYSQVEQQMDEAVRFAENSAWPDADAEKTGIWAE